MFKYFHFKCVTQNALVTLKQNPERYKVDKKLSYIQLRDWEVALESSRVVSHRKQPPPDPHHAYSIRLIHRRRRNAVYKLWKADMAIKALSNEIYACGPAHKETPLETDDEEWLSDPEELLADGSDDDLNDETEVYLHSDTARAREEERLMNLGKGLGHPDFIPSYKGKGKMVEEEDESSDSGSGSETESDDEPLAKKRKIVQEDERDELAEDV